MAVFLQNDVQVTVNSVDLTDHVASITWTESADELDTTANGTKDTFLGEVMLNAEMITNEQLEQAMHLHYREGIRIGEALVQLGSRINLAGNDIAARDIDIDALYDTVMRKAGR